MGEREALTYDKVVREKIFHLQRLPPAVVRPFSHPLPAAHSVPSHLPGGAPPAKQNTHTHDATRTTHGIIRHQKGRNYKGVERLSPFTVLQA